MATDSVFARLVMTMDEGGVDHPDTDLRLGVTVMVGGSLVSGYLVPAEHYIADLQENSNLGPWTSMLEHLRASSTNEEGPDHFHLAEATLIAEGGPITVSPHGMWRGRMSDVSGWTVGRLMPRLQADQ